MMQPSSAHLPSPSKRVLTQEAHNAFGASHSSSSISFIPDDLTAALQNVGARVRKRVNEGYLTRNPPTPFSSPAKPGVSVSAHSPHPSPSLTRTISMPSSSYSPTTQPIFRSASDTLHDVFSTPSPAKRSFIPPNLSTEQVDEPSSPCLPIRCRKRSRDELDEDPVQVKEDGEAMDEDEDVVFVYGRPGRAIKPLRRGSSSSCSPVSAQTALRSMANIADIQMSSVGSEGVDRMNEPHYPLTPDMFSEAF